VDSARAKDLLFADVAVALGAAEPPRLARAIEAFWAKPDGKGLADALVRGGMLNGEARAAVEAEVSRIVGEAGGDAAAAVARRGGVDPKLRESFSPATVEELGVGGRAPLRTIAPGRYEDFSVIGKGGMGLVYLALDTELNRRVAFKMVRPDPSASKDAAAPETPLHATPPSRAADTSKAFEELTVRFLQEAWVTGGMEHPGIVPVYELGRTEAGIPYYTMRYVRGERTLATAIRAADHLDARLALLEPFLKVCDTIAYAHARAIVHRDLKPENIALGEFGEAVVLDWGLAKTRGRPDVLQGAWRARVEELRAAADLRTVAGALGTAGYMSPEAALGRGDEVDERSDVHSLGAILFEILTGRLPFKFKTFVEYVQQLLEEDAPLAHEIHEAIPEELSRACAKALARKKEDRFASATEVAAAIRRWQTEGRVEQQAAELLDHARGELEAARRGTGNTVLWHLDRASSACSKVLHLRGGSQEALAVNAEIKQLRERGVRERVSATRRRALIGAGFLVLLVASIVALYVAQTLGDERADAEARVEQARGDAAVHANEAKAARDDAEVARAGRADLYAALAALYLKRHDAAAARIAAARALATAPSPAGYAALAAAEARWTPTLAALLEAPDAGPLVFGPDGRLYAAAGKSVKVQEGGRGGWKTTFALNEPARILAVSPDGDRLAVAGGAGVCVLDRDGKLVAALPDRDRTPADEMKLSAEAGAPSALVFDGSGERLFVGHESGAITDWDVAERNLQGMRGARTAGVTALTWDGEYLLVGDTDGTVSRIEVVRFEMGDSRTFGSAPVTQILPAEEGVVYASCLDHRLAVGEFGMETDLSGAFKVLTEFEAPGRARMFLFSPDRARLFAASATGAVTVWSAETRRETVRLLPEGAEVKGLALAPDGSLLAVSAADHTVRVFALDMRWPPEGPEPSSAVATAGRRTYLARPDLTLEAWDNAAGRRIARPKAGAATASALAVEGERVYLATLEGSLGIWSLALEPQATLKTPVTTALAPVPGADEILLGLLDGTVEVWSLRNRRRLATLEGEAGLPVKALRVAGGRIDAWDVTGAQRSWDAASRAPVPPAPARPPTPLFEGNAPPHVGPLEPWIARDATARLVEFENRYGLKLAGAEVVPVPLGEYDPATPRIDPWSR
jgi:serine/threonine protein kinase/WD40 repeat protein